MKPKVRPILRSDESTWIPFRKINCTGCQSLCCTLPVEVSVGELQRMELITPQETGESIGRIGRRLIKAGLVESYRTSLGFFTLKRHRNHDCVFLDEKRRCKIYRKRPQVCRKFPELGPRPGFCPAKPRTGARDLTQK